VLRSLGVFPAKSDRVTQQLPQAIAAPANNGSKLDAESEQMLEPSPLTSPLAEQPNSAVSWNNLGNSYAQKQEWIKAINCYQESLGLNPNLVKTYRNLAKTYLKIGKKDQAILYWYEAFNLEPDLVKPKEHFGLAQHLLQLRQVDKAIACLRYAIKLDPNFNQAYLVLGKLLNSLGKTDAAKACYARVQS
jgi:superkiller protein 3